jgi:hypothetical protein
MAYEALYEWVDQVQFSRARKNFGRDFSDGCLVAEVRASHLDPESSFGETIVHLPHLSKDLNPKFPERADFFSYQVIKHYRQSCE